MASLFALIAVAMVGVTLGTYLNGVLVLLPGQRRLSARSYIEQEQANTALGTMRYRILIAATITPQLLAAVFAAGTLSRILIFGSILTIIATTALVTVGKVVPINATVHRWDPADPPAEWTSVRDRWHRLHTLRTAGFALALVLPVIAAQPLLP